MKNYIETQKEQIKTLEDKYESLFSMFLSSKSPSEMSKNFEGDRDEHFKYSLISTYRNIFDEMEEIQKLIKQEKLDLEMALIEINEDEEKFNKSYVIWMKLFKNILDEVNNLFRKSLGTFEVLFILPNNIPIESKFLKDKFNSFMSQYKTVTPKYYRGSDIYLINLPSSLLITEDEHGDDTEMPSMTLSLDLNKDTTPEIIKISICKIT